MLAHGIPTPSWIAARHSLPAATRRRTQVTWRSVGRLGNKSGVCFLITALARPWTFLRTQTVESHAMGFQFQCPKGHMLEADPASVGQASACPFCGTQFLIPAPVAPTPAFPHGASAPQPGPAFSPQPAFGPQPTFAPPNRPSPQQAFTPQPAFPAQPYSPQHPAQPTSAGMAGPAIHVRSSGSMPTQAGPIGPLPTVSPTASSSGQKIGRAHV